MKSTYPLLALALALGLAAPAQAQWKWRDANGAIHYSDQPPPASVAAANILRGRLADPVPAAKPGAGPASAAPAPAPLAKASVSRAPAGGPPPAGAAKPGEAQRAGAAPGSGPAPVAEAPEPGSAQVEQLAQACNQLREEMRTLESGMRLARVNARGEQEILSDADRAKRVEVVSRELRASCPQS